MNSVLSRILIGIVFLSGGVGMVGGIVAAFSGGEPVALDIAVAGEGVGIFTIAAVLWSRLGDLTGRVDRLTDKVDRHTEGHSEK